MEVQALKCSLGHEQVRLNAALELGESDLMHPAQMEALGAAAVEARGKVSPVYKEEHVLASLGKGTACGPVEPAYFTGEGRYGRAKTAGEVWSYDTGYNKGGLKQCWNCLFTCDFTVDLEVHWQNRHGLQSAGQYTTSPIPTIDRVVGRTRQEVEERLEALAGEHMLYEELLFCKVEAGDWSGVRTAASDLLDIEAEVEGLGWVLGE